MVALSVVCTLVLASAAFCLADVVPLRALKNARYSNSWAVELDEGLSASDAERIAQKYGFHNLGVVGNLKNVYHFQLAVDVTTNLTTGGYKAIRQLGGSLAEMEHTPHLTAQMKGEETVVMVEQQIIKSHEAMYSYFYQNPNDVEWSNQWSLENTGQTGGPAGLDLNVEPAWLQGVTGSGVVVAIFDNGLETTHPDLSKNYDSHASWDFLHNDPDPTPDTYFGDKPDSHGTECAGVVGMERDNGNCGVGVAYDSNIAGLKFNVSFSTDLTVASALGHYDDYIDIYSNSWGPFGNGFIVGGPDSLIKKTFETGVREGRGGKGSIYVWAAGNGGWNYDSCAADGYSSSIYTIAMGSADQSGGQAVYDEQCAAKMAVTFSLNSNTFPYGSDPYDQLTTATLNGQCTDSFTGTSASTPLMSGVIALTLQANPNLSWRDVQYLIAYTSDRDSLVGGEWSTNGAGLKVSHKFGFGAVDAEAMVTRARRWINVPEQQSSTVYGTFRPDRQGPLIMTFDVTDSSAGGITFLEHVVLTATVSLSGYSRGYSAADFGNQNVNTYSDEQIRWLTDPHLRRGDFQIELTSPDSTTSILLPYRKYDFVNEEGYDNWPFMSVHHWGENPVGRWTLKIYLTSSVGGSFTGSDISMTLYGTTTTPESVSSIPYSCDAACAGACSGVGADNCDACSSDHYRIAETLECVYDCPTEMQPYGKYCLNGEFPTNVPPTASSVKLTALIGGTAGGGIVFVVGVIFLTVVVARAVRRARRLRPISEGFMPLESTHHTDV